MFNIFPVDRAICVVVYLDLLRMADECGFKGSSAFVPDKFVMLVVLINLFLWWRRCNRLIPSSYTLLRVLRLDLKLVTLAKA